MTRVPSFAARAIRVVLVAALFAAGSPHQHSGSARPWDAHTRDQVRSSASHPSSPHHMERLEIERAPRCPVCSLRDKLSAVRPAFASLRAERPVVDVPSSTASPVLSGAHDSSRPRGPPLA